MIHVNDCPPNVRDHQGVLLIVHCFNCGWNGEMPKFDPFSGVISGGKSTCPGCQFNECQALDINSRQLLIFQGLARGLIRAFGEDVLAGQLAYDCLTSGKHDFFFEESHFNHEG